MEELVRGPEARWDVRWAREWVREDSEEEDEDGFQEPMVADVESRIRRSGKRKVLTSRGGRECSTQLNACYPKGGKKGKGKLSQSCWQWTTVAEVCRVFSAQVDGQGRNTFDWRKDLALYWMKTLF